MAEKTLNVRILLKNDIAANWRQATGFTPKQGEPIVVTESGKAPILKIGNNSTTASALIGTATAASPTGTIASNVDTQGTFGTSGYVLSTNGAGTTSWVPQAVSKWNTSYDAATGRLTFTETIAAVALTDASVVGG